MKSFMNSPVVQFVLTAILAISLVAGCVALAKATPLPTPIATSTPDPMYTKDWSQFEVVVRTANNQLMTDWYGDEILWPEDPFTPSGHWFVLTPAVRESWFGRTVEGGLYTNPHMLQYGATVFVLYQQVLDENYLSDLSWDEINIPNDAFDKKYCTVNIRLRIQTWIGKDCEVVEFDWEYETGQFIHLAQAIEYGYLLGEKDVLAGDLWIPIDQVGYVEFDEPWADQINDLTYNGSSGCWQCFTVSIEHGELIINK